jgi:hypothetical protein
VPTGGEYSDARVSQDYLKAMQIQKKLRAIAGGAAAKAAGATRIIK